MNDKVIKIYAATDIGTKEENQDHIGYYSIEETQMLDGKKSSCESVIHDIQDGCLAVVSDGVSQFANSASASKIVVQAMIEHFPSFLLGNEDYIRRSVLAADETVRNYARHVEGRERAYAATMSALYVNDKHFIACNVGDSPIFLLRDRELTPLAHIDTLAQRKLDQGIDPEAIKPSDGHTLVQCFGQAKKIEPHVYLDSCKDNDIFIVMSDWTEDITLLKNRLLAYKDFNTGENPAQMLIEFMHRKAPDKSYIDNSSIIIMYATDTEDI